MKTNHAEDLHPLAQLDRSAVERRVHVMAADGMSDHEIARLLGLHVEMVRRMLVGRPNASHSEM